MVRLINKTAVNAAGSGIYDCVADIIYADRDFFSDFFESKRKPEKINRHYYLCHSNGTEFTLVSRFFRPEISRSFSGGALFAVILFGANFSDFLHQLQNGILFITSLRNLDSFRFIPEYRHCRFKLKKGGINPPFPHCRFIL